MIRARAREEFRTKKIFEGKDFFGFSPSKKQYKNEGDTLASLKKIGEHFYAYYSGQDFFISKGLRCFIDEEVQNKATKERLDKELLKLIKSGKGESFIFLHDKAFAIAGRNIRFGEQKQTFDDFLKTEIKRLSSIHSYIKIRQMKKTETQEIPLSRLIYSLPIEDSDEKGNFYRFSQGEWLCVDPSRFESIKKFLRERKINREELGLPGYCLNDTMGDSQKDYEELCYNRRAALVEEALLIDRNNITLESSTDKFEFGDILLNKNGHFYIIHVKRAGVSDLSHHREQAERSAEYLGSYLAKGKEEFYPNFNQLVDDFYIKHGIGKPKNKHFDDGDVSTVLSGKKSNKSIKIKPSNKKFQEQNIKLNFINFIGDILNKDVEKKKFFNNCPGLFKKVLNALYEAVSQKKIDLEKQQNFTQHKPILAFFPKKDNSGVSRSEQEAQKSREIPNFLKKVIRSIQKDTGIAKFFFQRGIFPKENLSQITLVLALIDDREVRRIREEKIGPDKKNKSKKEKNDAVRNQCTEEELLDESRTCSGQKSPLFKNQDLWGLERTAHVIEKKGLEFKICIINEESGESWDAFGNITTAEIGQKRLSFSGKNDESNPKPLAKKRKDNSIQISSDVTVVGNNPMSKIEIENPELSDNVDVISDDSDVIIDEDSDDEFALTELEKLKVLKEEKLNTSEIQRLPFPGANNGENGLYPEYWTVPTIGDGDCFFHALSVGNPFEIRDQFCDKVENDETYAERFKDIVLEHYRSFQESEQQSNIPETLMKLFQENNDYAITRNMLERLKVNPFPAEVQGQELHSDEDLKAQLTHDDIKKYIAPFKSTARSYIPFRPKAYCPALALAEFAQKRVNIFTYDHGRRECDNRNGGKEWVQEHNPCLVLTKSIMPENSEHWSLINILHEGIHFTRLYHPNEGEGHKQQCEEVYGNFKRKRYGI